jgi:hypothetical protein
MKDHKEQTSGEDIRMSNFSQVIALIFVTVVIIGSVISILFF